MVCSLHDRGEKKKRKFSVNAHGVGKGKGKDRGEGETWKICYKEGKDETYGEGRRKEECQREKREKTLRGVQLLTGDKILAAILVRDVILGRVTKQKKIEETVFQVQRVSLIVRKGKATPSCP